MAAVPRAGDLSPQQKQKLYEEFGLWERGYTMGVLSFTVNTFLLSRFPQYFWCWHLLKAFVHLPWRLVRFRQRGYEWYMLDFCYLNTYFTVGFCLMAFIRSAFGVNTHLGEQNYWLIRALFAFANGALLLAVPMFGNKLVFHDVDNTTSMYIHLSPALLFWTLRWGGGFGTSLIESTWPGMFHVCNDMQAGDGALDSFAHMLWYTDDCAGTLSQFVLYPALGWIILWGLPYYIFVLCCMKGWLEKHEKLTLYHSTVQDSKGQGRLITAAPEALWPFLYMVQHFAFTCLTGLLSIFMWNSFALNTAFLAGIVLYSIHNGSTFMFRVVAARHAQEVLLRVAAEGATSGQDSP